MKSLKKPLVIKYKELLALLNKLKGSARQKLIERFKGPHIDCLSEIFKNLLLNKIPVKRKTLQKLRKYHTTIRSLACKRPTLSHKKRILLSRRGGSILSIILPLAVSLISRLFK